MLYYLLPPLIPPGVIPQTEAICPWPARYKLIARLFRSNCNPENKMHPFPQDVRLLKSWVGGPPTSNVPLRSHKCRRRGWRFAMQMRVWFDKQTCKVAFTEPTWVHHGNQPLGPLSLPTGTATFGKMDSQPPPLPPSPSARLLFEGSQNRIAFARSVGTMRLPHPLQGFGLFITRVTLFYVHCRTRMRVQLHWRKRRQGKKTGNGALLRTLQFWRGTHPSC